MQAWLQARREEAWISEWVLTEAAAALSTKVRMGEVSADRRALMDQMLEGLCRTMPRLEIETSHFRAAAGFAARPELALRGADALHLALAANLRARLVTLDQALARAAAAIGLGSEQP